MARSTYTFRTEPNGPVRLRVIAATRTEAFDIANKALVPDIPGFYAWMGDGPDFYATTGVWD